MSCRSLPPCKLARPLPLLALLFLLTGCFWPDEPSSQLPLALPTSFAGVPLAVGSSRYTVEQGDVLRTQTFDGVVQVSGRQEIFFTGDGRVANVHVSSGDPVHPGDLLAELEADEAALDLDEAQLRVQLAEQQWRQAQTAVAQAYDTAQLTLEIAQLKLEQLQWNPDTPRQEIEIAEREVKLAQTAVDQAEAGVSTEANIGLAMAQTELDIAKLALTRAERAMARLQLRAPITGTVRLGPELRPGTAVQAYAAVAGIVDPTTLLVESNLATSDLELLYEGMPVTLEATYLPGQRIPATITTLPQPFGSGNTPATLITPDPASTAGQLREGASVTVGVEVGRRQAVPWLPNDAIQTIGGQSYVVIDDDGQLRDQPITPGLVGDTRTEILEGLTPGMRVVGP